MPALRTLFGRSFGTLLRLALICVLLSACSSLSETPAPTVTTPSAVPAPAVAMAEVTFEVQLPAKLGSGQNLYFEMLDEVTGLALNASRARMSTDDGSYFGVKIPIAVGSVVKYRYARDNDAFATEYTTAGEQVRYRMYYVDGPGVVRDVLAAWKSTPAPAEKDLGRIQGQVAFKNNNAPAVNAFVAAGGMQTLTSSDGSFILEGLPPGTHNLVVYSPDGSFQPFQQGAVVAPESTTPALILVNPSKLVTITFLAHLPQVGPVGAPLRLIGNTYPLGNTFADLDGGMNTLASRAPLMTLLPDSSYSLTLKLPAGLDLRYKYTLGDGFWNGETTTSGGIRVRQLIVPDKDTTINDTVEAWKTPGLAPITFQVKVPADTPVSDSVSIQFNPFGWTQPIPMWPIGKNEWFYVLYNPQNLFTSAAYRYCRNDQCSTADASSSAGAAAQGKTFTPKSTEQHFTDTVDGWAWLDTKSEQIVVQGSQITPRDASFQVGVEFLPQYHPSWQPYLSSAFQNVKDLGSNTVMLTPTWHMVHQNPPVMAPAAGQDPMWLDLTQSALQAQQKGLSIAIHPVLRYDQLPQEWWAKATRDAGWWQTWFGHYQTYLIYHADLATQTGAKTLVIGDADLLPALPGGKLADGSPSNVPGDAEARWNSIISAVRARYRGKIAWMMPYSGQLPAAPAFLKDVDLIYVQMTAPLAKSDQASTEELQASISAALDGDILKLQEKTNHPILLGLQYPSVSGDLDACVDTGGGKCAPASAFEQPAPEVGGAKPGLKEQADVYSAVLSAVNQRSWIAGFYAAGYYPPVELRDLSVSVRNKPAGDVLWYWYPRMSGVIKP